MFKGWKTYAGLIVVGALFMGCNKEEEKPTAPANPPPQPQATAENAANQGAAAATEGTAAASNATAAATEEAQKLLDQTTTYIKDHKWDLADQTLNKLEAMKSQLPAEWAGKIDGARKAFDAAKAAGGLQIPGAGGTPAAPAAPAPATPAPQ